MNRASVYGLTCVLMLTAIGARATTIVLPTDEQLVAKSPIIVEGTVISTVPVDRDGAIWTDSAISVARVLKGTVETNARGTITVREPGGELGDRITKIYGVAEFEAGQRVLLFLEPSPRGGYRTIDLFAGKFTQGETMNGRRLWLRDDEGQGVILLDAQLQPIAVGNAQRDAAGFESFLIETAAGRKGDGNYGVENPVLAGTPVDRSPLTSNFTLISEPTVYRWFLFDSGQSTPWYSGGTQPGYAGGGTSELQTAMTAWNGYSQAKINYAYAGTRSGSLGGIDTPNGVNEVLFNDPLNDIPGSWNGSSGVVGIGGFNGVSSGGNWTAPFTADSSHPAGVVHAFSITEANLSIQDGVSPSMGIPSSELAEIIAHELGHTLGFGHSTDPSALMYATISPGGASLRADDQLAARWLYPNGSAPPPPSPDKPAAPSSLVATASGSSIDLRWNDNASNETSQSIYMAVGSGPFAKVATVGANVESAKLTGLSAGSYRIYVVATSSAGSSAPSNTATATIASTTVANFSVTPQSGTAGVTTFTFYDESTGPVSSRSWKFGDGATSSALVATHVYSTGGAYMVTLTVNGGESSASKTVIVSGPLNAAFSWSPSNPTPSGTVQFTDQSSGGPTSWSWQFGDGTTSTQQNPSKSYAVAGTYSVQLTVSRSGQSSTASRTLTVSTIAPPPAPTVVAAFDVSTSTPSVGTSVVFTDRSSGAPTTWDWSFGDGSSSSAENPAHAFSSPGAYTVALTASNGSSSDTTSRQVTVSAVTDFRTLVSVMAQTGGVGGTSWRTELTLFNAGSQGANVDLSYVPSAGGTAQTKRVFLSPLQSHTYANALLDLFGIPSGAGALGVEAASAGSSADLRVTSRTFTTGPDGTYGQSVPEVLPNGLAQTIYIAGIESSDAFRTNLGLVNRAAAPVTATLTLYSKDGATSATKILTLGGNSFQQAPLVSFFPEIGGRALDVLSMRIASSAEDAVSAYASVIDNATQDPVYIQAVPATTANSLTIPVVGRTPGANGTFWRSDVTLFNPTFNRIVLILRYDGASRTVILNGGATQVLSDVLSTFAQSSGSGALSISWSGGSSPVVTSRTYTTVAAGGTYGQSIDPVAAFASRQFVPGLRNDGSYRSNVGFVNGGVETETLNVKLLSPAGSELGRTVLTLARGEQVQYAVSALFPSVGAEAFTLEVEGDGNAQLFAYGTMVDNRSGDPVCFAGR